MGIGNGRLLVNSEDQARQDGREQAGSATGNRTGKMLESLR